MDERISSRTILPVILAVGWLLVLGRFQGARAAGNGIRGDGSTLVDPLNQSARSRLTARTVLAP
jgi:hypothetical protein